MNRAWIPAGALAGVSVAGLLAMGPLTDSMSTPVSFPGPVKVVPSVGATRQSSSRPVSLVLNLKSAVGSTETAALRTTRGGHASAFTTSSSEGQVALKLHSQLSTHTATAVTHSTTTHTATPPAKPKKVVKRLQSIGTVGETNSDSGFAGGSGGKTSTGESSPTPSSSGS